MKRHSGNAVTTSSIQASDLHGESDMRVRCITMNLKGVEYGWFEGRSSVLIEGLRKHNPDIICVQESTVRQDSPIYNQARAIGTALGLETCIFSPYGNPAEMITRDQ
jgi:hypothetical protein